MPTETEAKFRVDSFEPVRLQLQHQGARLLGEYDETNRFFDDAPPRLLRQDAGLRLRSSRDRTTGQSVHRLTYKGPRQASQVKQREEIELTIDDPAACTLLLHRLGFEPVLRFEKLRQSWQLGDCRIELDDLPELGRFVEIEGPDEQTILTLRDRLGLARLPIIRESYPALLSEFNRPEFKL